MTVLVRPSENLGNIGVCSKLGVEMVLFESVFLRFDLKQMHRRAQDGLREIFALRGKFVTLR